MYTCATPCNPQEKYIFYIDLLSAGTDDDDDDVIIVEPHKLIPCTESDLEDLFAQV